MAEGQLLVAEEGGVALMRVVGRGTFKLAVGLSRWIEQLKAMPELKSVMLDLSGCSSLDSTFMGLMVTLARQSRGRCALLVVNATPEHHSLLDGIGVMRVWKYVDQPVTDLTWQNLASAADGATTLDERTRKLILAAHETLIELDQANEPKFRDVVDMLKAEDQSL